MVPGDVQPQRQLRVPHRGVGFGLSPAGGLIGVDLPDRPSSVSSFTFCSTVGQLSPSRWDSSIWEIRSQVRIQRSVLERLCRFTSILLAGPAIIGYSSFLHILFYKALMFMIAEKPVDRKDFYQFIEIIQ